jgi:uncharacterized protein (DUF924 family)
MKTAADVLDFWFVRHGEADWFGAKPEFDVLLAREFAETHAAVAKGEAWHWRQTPDGRLAEIIVLDQFSRQLFRGRPEAFASDAMALALAQEAVAGGHHLKLEPRRRTFVLMPYMHSESPAVHVEAVRLFTELANAETLKFELAHRDCIAKFGRYPRRNAALGRESTDAERDYMASGTGMF